MEFRLARLARRAARARRGRGVVPAGTAVERCRAVGARALAAFRLSQPAAPRARTAAADTGRAERGAGNPAARARRGGGEPAREIRAAREGDGGGGIGEVAGSPPGSAGGGAACPR